MAITTSVSTTLPGLPDHSFGSAGVVILQNLIRDPKFTTTHRLKGLAIDTQRRLLISAHLFDGSRNQSVYALGRIDPQGKALDKTFGEDGLIYGTFIDNVEAVGGKVAIQQAENGKIFMLGLTVAPDGWANLAVTCFDHRGQLDRSFGENGLVIIETPPDKELLTDRSSLSIQPDNKLLIVPYYISRGTPKALAAVLWRLSPNGEPDKEFNGGGRWEFRMPDLPDASTTISACILQEQKIVIAGHAESGVQKKTAVLLRLNANGQIDSSFGDRDNPGFHLVNVANRSTIFNALAARRDGTLIGAGSALSTLQKRAAGLLVALTPDGVPQRLFNNGKPLLTELGTKNDIEWASVLAQGDNQIVTASKGILIYIARFQPAGELDMAFNGQGYTDLRSESLTDPVLLTYDQTDRKNRIIVSANVLGTNPEGVGTLQALQA